MNLCIKLGGIEYLPLRCVPIVTSSLLNTPTLADMISNPDAFCDAEHDDGLSVYSYQSPGLIHAVAGSSFAYLRSKPTGESAHMSARHLPSGMLVRRASTYAMFRLIVEEVGYAYPGRVQPFQTVWNETPNLARSEVDFILEDLPTLRLNSAGSLSARIVNVMANIERRVKPQGIQIDHLAMPGTRAVWADLVFEIDPTTTRAMATMEGYFKRLGFRWLSGSRPNQINPIRKALELTKI